MNKSATEYLNVLSVISCLAVVLLHFNGVFWAHPSGNLWITANIIETFFYFAVPVFLMITGITLIDYRERYNTKDFLLKRFKRTVIPFLIWSLIAYLWVNRHSGHISLSPLHIAKGILFHRFVSIYWFFTALFAIYLSIPVLSLLEQKIKCFSYMVLYFFITVCIGSVLKECRIEIIPEQLQLPICGGYLVYPLLGYILHNTHIGTKGRIAIYIAGILATAAHFYATAYIPTEDGSINCLLKGYLKFPAVLQSAAILVFVKYNATFILNTLRLRAVCNFIKPTTLSIYLMHIYIYQFLCTYCLDKANPVQYISAGVLAFLLLAAVVRMLQKIPGAKYVFP